MQTTLSVSLKGAPTNANESAIPNGVSILDLALDKNAPAQTGLMLRDVSSSGAFLALEGPGVTVSEVTLLVLRVSAPVIIELTQDSVASEVPINRFFAAEFDPTKPLTLLRIKGVAKVEYFASGLQ